MGTCVICGKGVDGVDVCASHEQDVYFEFRGTEPDQLTTGRFYRGEVDGFADFGVFVDIGERVTGLLHESELDRRLESLDWKPGDTVFVEVKNIRENGNVDLGWSIRQHASEFRGGLIDDPTGEESGRIEPDEGSAADPQPDPDPEPEPEPEPESHPEPEPDPEPAPESQPESGPEPEPTRGGGATQLERATVDSLPDHQGGTVRIEGEVADVRQTGGPTIFEVRDETGTVDCAAFEAAGVRAYPKVEAGDAVRVVGEVEERRGEIQVETEALEALDGEDREAVEERIRAAIEERAQPPAVDLLADHPGVEAAREEIVAAATEIRRAAIEARPVVVRHSAGLDGYLAGAAIERAVLPLVREEHDGADAEYHYIDRRPLSGRVYGMDDAVRDTTRMLDANERHDEKVPLFAFVNAGSTGESRDGFDLLDTYDADRVVIDGDHPDEAMAEAADAFLSPFPDGPDAEATSTTALAANVAAHVNEDVRDDLRHLPAASYWRDAPEAYLDLAAEAGYDAGAVRELREAVAVEAFYGTHEGKREIVTDLLFDGVTDLISRAAEQYRERVDAEIRTAKSHVQRHDVGGATVAVLDVDAFTHAREFPATDTLLPELAGEVDADAIFGLGEDELRVFSARPVDMRAVGEAVAAAAPDAGVETRAGRDGWLVFLSGERDAVAEAAVDAVGEEL